MDKAMLKKCQKATKEWAEASGYQSGQSDGPASKLSPMARNCQRIINASNFGCQQRNVAALISEVIGEKFEVNNNHRSATGPVEYIAPQPPVEGVILCYAGEDQDFGHRLNKGQLGAYCHISQNGNAQIRLTNGDVAGQHIPFSFLRPASEDEIKSYLEEFYSTGPLAVIPTFGDQTPF